MTGGGTLFDRPPGRQAAATLPARSVRGSAASEAGARRIESKRPLLQACILAALEQAGPAGLTIEELAVEVGRLRGTRVKEDSIRGRICGEHPEMAGVVMKAKHTRPSKAGVQVAVFILARFELLQPASMPPELHEDYEERAAIHEYLGNLSREEAERLAWASVATRGNGSSTPAGEG